VIRYDSSNVCRTGPLDEVADRCMQAGVLVPPLNGDVWQRYRQQKCTPVLQCQKKFLAAECSGDETALTRALFKQ